MMKPNRRLWGTCLALCALAITASNAMAQGEVKLPFGDRLPQNALELIQMRRYFDDTVWATEVVAQNYEMYFVKLWDRLIHERDKYRVLMDAQFGTLAVGTDPKSTPLDWGIEMLDFTGEKRMISAANWLTELRWWEDQGYRIIETEFHHSEFKQPTDGPATSTVAMLIHATHPDTQRRFLVKGDLKITWKAGSTPVPELVDASGLKVYQRTGTPAFTEALKFDVPMDYTGREHRTTLHPMLIQDLNEDGLPEIIFAGVNQIHWNRGNWNFEQKALCRVDPGHVNAGLIADLDGDGVRDLLVAVKSGFPLLYRGAPGGQFDGQPEPLQFTSERLILPVAIAAADIENDGDLDVYITQQKPGYESGDIPTPYYDALDSFPAYLLENDGRGRFRDITAISGLGDKRLRRNFASSFLDIDRDGDADLVMTSDFSGTDVFLNDGRGAFTDITSSIQPRPAGFGMGHTFADFNMDSRIDFFMVGMSSTTARRLTAMQLGRQEFPDYNEERMNMGYGNRLILNTESGLMQAPFNQGVARSGWAWGTTNLDFDNDGDKDIYVVNGQTSGKTTQDYCTRFWCHDIYYKTDGRPVQAVTEFFDGLAPLFQGNSISWNGFEHNTLLMNRQGKEFVNVAWVMDAASEFDSRSAASADFDGDGRMDLIFEHVSPREAKQVVFALRNQWDQPGNWIGVNLRQSAGTPSPLGAYVTIQPRDGQQQVHPYVVGDSVWAQHDTMVHFGLGSASEIEWLEVAWANGTTTRLEAPAANKYHVITGNAR